MRPLSAQDILRIWEVGLRQHPIDRVLTILAAACPEMKQDELAALSIGERDGLLLSLREHTFGSRLSCLSECPECRERIEFIFDISAIRAGRNGEGDGRIHRTVADGCEIVFRLPDSTDLAAAAVCGDVVSARDILVRRCVMQTYRNGVEISSKALTETAISLLSERMAESDPRSEIQIALNCPTCGHRWQAIFEIAAFLWAEIQAQAKRLMREVHILASAYGWREADILSMSAVRRRFYLEMTT